MRVVFAIFFLAILAGVETQAQSLMYWLELKDKAESRFSVDRPEDFLSERAIQRRLRQGIPVDHTDLPVSDIYIDRVEKLGAKVRYPSKWLNAVLVSCDEKTISIIATEPFVKSIRVVNRPLPKTVLSSKSGMHAFSESIDIDRSGFAEAQLTLMKGDFLFEQGFRGQQKIIAVFDGGFIGLQDNHFFDSLHFERRLRATKDFVDGDNNVDQSSTHGTKVLSLMAANQPGLLQGAAVDANYVCIRTENRKIEMLVEECNWIAAAEYADSLGVDVISSSLGYTRFIDPLMNYYHEDMDGNTALSSRAADFAFEKGMLVVSSAGNTGFDKEGYLMAPGDAKHILTVGATDMNGKPADFSTRGETADGRQKPEIFAPGKDVAVAAALLPQVHQASGTSYAAPLVAGLSASLWSAFPEANNKMLRAAIVESVNAEGLPDFKKAFELLERKTNKQ